MYPNVVFAAQCTRLAMRFHFIPPPITGAVSLATLSLLAEPIMIGVGEGVMINQREDPLRTLPET